MAIRDVVTMGYGNGTYSPGVSKLPTLGYSLPGVLTLADGVFEQLSRGRVFPQRKRGRVFDQLQRGRVFGQKVT